MPRWRLDHSMHPGELQEDVKLQQAPSAVCALAHSGCAGYRPSWAQKLRTFCLRVVSVLFVPKPA